MYGYGRRDTERLAEEDETVAESMKLEGRSSKQRKERKGSGKRSPPLLQPPLLVRSRGKCSVAMAQVEVKRKKPEEEEELKAEWVRMNRGGWC